MTTKELVELHNEDLKRDGLFEKSVSAGTTRADFRRALNASLGGRVEEGGRQYRNHVYGNRSRAYGDYLYRQDRDMFENDYHQWLAGNYTI
jgi:hypothetical protein